MLGPQWSKEELEHFYQAYRKHGKDWKKVSSRFKSKLWAPSQQLKKIFSFNFSKQQYLSFLVAVILFSKSVAYKPTMTCLVSDMNCNLLP